MNNLATDADPNANIPLPTEAYERISKMPDVVSLGDAYRHLAECLKDKYGSIKDAPGSAQLLQQYEQAKRKYRAKKEFHKTQMLAQLRLNFFAFKDTVLIEAQLNGSGVMRTTKTRKEVPALSIPERSALARLIGADDMRSASMLSQKVAAVQLMVDLCFRVELRKVSVPTRSYQLDRSPVELEAAATDNIIPVRCNRLQCLFCIGDERLTFQDRTRIFSQLHTLWRHVKTHLNALTTNDDIPCPHPTCRVEGITVKSVQHLMNHAQKEHDIRLQSR